MARPGVEVVHVGSACRDVVPEDPRGWRLGGGVTYASLTTARLGLRTAAIVGVDSTAATASELDMLRQAGVDLLLVPLEEGPIFHNLETPKGRMQTSVKTGVPLPVPAMPESWLAAPGWSLVPVAGELTDAWADAIPADAHLAVAWQGFLRDLKAGEQVRRRPPRPSPILRRADLVGVSHHDVPAETPLSELYGLPGSARRPAHHPGRRRRAADPARSRWPGRIAALPADGDRRGERPDRRRRHVPGRAPGVDPAAGGGRPDEDPAPARPALRRGRRVARRGGAGSRRRAGPCRRPRAPRPRTDPPRGDPDRGQPGGGGRGALTD